MGKGNPNPVHKFSASNQPKNRKKSNKALTAMLRKLMKAQPDGGKKFTEELIELVLQELRDVKSGKKQMESLHVKLIDMIWDRFEGPVTQEHEVEVTGGGIVVLPENMDAALKQRELEGQRKVEEEEGDDDE
jgi:hypothetical protein